MDPNNVHGAMILIPKPGNHDAVIAQASEFAKYVEDNEPGVVMFSIARSKAPLNPDAPEEIVIAVTFKDQAAADAHRASEHRIAFQEKAMKADLCVGPPEIRAMQPVGGFPPRFLKGL